MNYNNIKLDWDNFETNAPNTIRRLWNDQDFTDVTLATADYQQIRAHKVILSSSSEFFRNIFLKNPHKNPLIYLKGIRYKELVMVIKFIYLGQCEVGQYELENVLSTGKDLEVRGLMEDVNLKNTVEPVLDNETNNTKEKEESGSNYRDMLPQNIEKEVILPSTQMEGGRFACSECNTGFGSNRSLLDHNKSKHEAVRFNCDLCDSNFTQQSDVTKHKRSKHEEMTYGCNQCDYKATDQSNLTYHKQLIHEGMTYDCGQCDYKASQQRSLTCHKQYKHGLRYYCDQCDSSFAMQQAVTRHKKSKHQGVGYGCNQCDYKATQQSDLKSHKQTKHLGMSY